MHAQATPVGVYKAFAASPLAYVAGHCQAAVALVDAERLDVVLALRPHRRPSARSGPRGSRVGAKRAFRRD